LYVTPPEDWKFHQVPNSDYKVKRVGKNIKEEMVFISLLSDGSQVFQPKPIAKWSFPSLGGLKAESSCKIGSMRNRLYREPTMNL
jgi:hypothetical protein